MILFSRRIAKQLSNWPQKTIKIKYQAGHGSPEQVAKNYLGASFI